MRTSIQIVKMIEEKLTEGIRSVKADLENILQKRFDEHDKQINTTNKQGIDYSVAVQKSGQQQTTAENFREIARMAKLEELEEENQIRRRQNNIIIHGTKETENTTDDSDAEFVHGLMKELCFGAVKAKFMARIGKKDQEKYRPLKVTFHNEGDKSKVLENLKQLKGKSDFDGISIKDDFTISERNIIKDYVQKANDKNES